MGSKSNTLDHHLLRRVVDQSPLAIFWVDEAGVIGYANESAAIMVGYSLDDLVGKSVAEIIIPIFTHTSFKNHWNELLQNEAVHFRSTLTNSGGEEKPVEIESHLYTFNNDKICCMYFTDISEITGMEHTLNINEKRWKAGLEVLSEGVWDWDINKQVVRFSPQWVKNFGFSHTAPSLLDRLQEIVHVDDRDNVRARLQKHLNREIEEYKSRHRIKDEQGKWRWVRDRGKVISRDKKGKAERMIGTTQDVTDIIEAEKQLRLSQERLLKNSRKSLEDIRDKFLNIFNNSNDAIFIGDPEKNVIVDVNPKACEILGYSKPELLNLSISEIIPNQTKIFIDFFNRVKRNKSADTDRLVFKSKAGERIFSEVSASVFSINGESGILGIVHTASDEGKFERVIGQVTEAAIVNPQRGL
ncbi:MAG: PAS domain S-box protein, partial [Fulvivirga sp.]|nr:PAS domain S-box protein [Fulvivirga sp.]